MKATRKYENEAKEFCKAIKLMADNDDALENFELYLSYHFEAWLKNYANTPENISAELKDFANIYTLTDIL